MLVDSKALIGWLAVAKMGSRIGISVRLELATAKVHNYSITINLKSIVIIEELKRLLSEPLAYLISIKILSSLNKNSYFVIR